uniref:Uncharacterized protein n=1 Tax=Eutreptiella gymnastica TaxID=73025 RepID=A0A7S4LF43_9EUGL|mmetsp:Transcript_50097/g.82574  ORF Transcript_50097/g.82574 Transcript_50097/m.82574 type:complete len:107 (+) Transcript_50097:44-364(+)
MNVLLFKHAVGHTPAGGHSAAIFFAQRDAASIWQVPRTVARTVQRRWLQIPKPYPTAMSHKRNAKTVDQTQWREDEMFYGKRHKTWLCRWQTNTITHTELFFASQG